MEYTKLGVNPPSGIAPEPGDPFPSANGEFFCFFWYAAAASVRQCGRQGDRGLEPLWRGGGDWNIPNWGSIRPVERTRARRPFYLIER